MTTVAEKFAEAWAEEVADRQERSPSFSPEDYTATGRAGKEYGGKRNTQWWLDNGPQMVQDWIDWRQETNWALWETPDGRPGVELEFLFQLPGLGLPIKAFIDRVFVLPTGELAILDLKTGRSPETAEQLGLYRVAIGMAYGVEYAPTWGYFWSPGGKGHGQPLDLSMYTPDYFVPLYNQAIAGINAGAFLPIPANNCKNWCGVARFCAAVGGAEAAGVDSLAG